MGAVAFDTLKFSKKLIAVGFTTQQAETLATEQADLVDQKLATKYDIKLLEQKLEAGEERMTSRIDALEQSTASRIDALEQSTAHELKALRSEIRATEQRMTIRLGAIMAVGIGVIAALNQFLPVVAR